MVVADEGHREGGVGGADAALAVGDGGAVAGEAGLGQQPLDLLGREEAAGVGRLDEADPFEVLRAGDAADAAVAGEAVAVGVVVFI